MLFAPTETPSIVLAVASAVWIIPFPSIFNVPPALTVSPVLIFVTVLPLVSIVTSIPFPTVNVELSMLFLNTVILAVFPPAVIVA